MTTASDSPGSSSSRFLAELGLDGRPRPVVDISALLASATHENLSAEPEDNMQGVGFVLVVPKQDEAAAVTAIAEIRVPFVRVVGAHCVDDVATWVCGKARLGVTVLEEWAE